MRFIKNISASLLIVLLSACLQKGAGTGTGPGSLANPPSGGMAGPSTDGSPFSAGGSGGGSGTGGGAGETGTPPEDSPPGDTSESPITVSGNPLGTIPTDRCQIDPGYQIFFGEAKMAITGHSNESGREILLRTSVWAQNASGATEPIGDRFVRFTNTKEPPAYYGGTASSSGCVFAKIYAPEEAAGQIVRLSMSLKVCQPESDVVPEMSDTFAMYRTTGRQEDLNRRGPGGFSGSTAVTGTFDIVIPSETAESTLPACEGQNWPQDLWNEYMTEELTMRMIEKQKSKNESGDTFKKSIIQTPAHR